MQETKYKIEYNIKVLDQLEGFSHEIKKLILKSIEKKLTSNPYEFGKPLQYSLKTYYRLRVGDYRVIYKIFEKEVIVLIIEIGHRREIYD